MTRITGLFIAVFLLFLVGCGGLPKDLKKSVETTATSITNTENIVTKESEQFASFKKAEDYTGFLKVYAAPDRENWDNYFVVAREKLAHAADLKKVLDSLVDKNDEESEQSVRANLQALQSALKDATASAKHPLARANTLLEARKNAPAMNEKAQKTLTNATKTFNDLQQYVNKQKSTHSEKTEDIDKLYNQVKDVYDKENQAATTAQQEYFKTQTDYAVFANSCAQVNASHANFVRSEKGLHSKLGELDRDYSKVLIDQWADYYVQIGRTSWDNYYDFPTEHEHKYSSRKVSEDVYEYFGDLPDNAVLAVGKGSSKVDGKMWSSLTIAWNESWPRGDDDAEFWLEDTPAKFFHKYVIIQSSLGQGAAKVDTVEEEVSAEFFDEHWDDLGMSIVTKEYGIFENEAIKAATPPGMNMVGDGRYGKWETDKSTGDRHWSWFESYMMYRLIWGPSYYPYSHYDYGYYRGNYYGRPYYGSDRRPNNYGTSSKRTQTRYAGSKFSRKGGFRAQAASVKGAGRKGGGPGGRGK